MKLYLLVLMVCFWWLYWCAEGMIQGWIWADNNRRDNNPLIIGNKGTWDPNAGSKILYFFKPPWDFHFVRILEVAGIFGAMLFSVLATFSAFTYGMSMTTFLWKWFVLVVGSGLCGAAFYEMLLNYVNNGVVFKEEDYRWHIGGFSVPWPTGYFGLMTLFLVGIGVMVVGFVFIK